MESAHTKCTQPEVSAPLVDRPRYLPRAIQRALDRILAIREEVGGALIRPTKVNQLVLQQLIRCTDAVQHFKPIIVRKETLASFLGVSKPTIDRALKTLEHGGWITRTAQCKSRKRGFQVGEIVLSDLAIEYLFPTTTPLRVGQGAAIDESNLCESKTIHALQEFSVSKETASKRHPAARSPFDESRANQIEPNLQVLLDYLSPKEINWLKGMATKHGKLLEHIVLATKKHFGRVEKLKLYLLACIKRETDFAAVIHHEASKQAEKAEKAKIVDTQTRLQAESINQLYKVDLDRIPFALVEEAGLVSVFSSDPRQPGAHRSGTMPFGEFAKRVLLKNKAQPLGHFSIGEFYTRLLAATKSGPAPSNRKDFLAIKKIINKTPDSRNIQEIAPKGFLSRPSKMIFV